MKRRPKPRRKIGKRNHCKFLDEKAKGEACGLLTCLKDSGDKKTEDLDWKILRFFGGLRPNKPPVLPGEIKNFSICKNNLQ